MHNKPHTTETKQKLSLLHTGKPNLSRRREIVEKKGIKLYRCGKCGQFKPYEEFYKNNRTILGITSECKRCHCKTTIMSRDKDKARKTNREYMKRKRLNNLETVRAMDRERSLVRLKDEKYKARMILNIAVRDGKVYKPNICQDCGKETKLYAHHPDYSQPLLVEWLCSECHGKRHRKVV